MTVPAERIIEKAKRVGEESVPDPDRDLPPLSHERRADRDGATEWVEKLERRAPIGGVGEPEPEPFDDTFERMRALDQELKHFDW